MATRSTSMCWSGALQQRDLGRVARRQRVLLSEPAGIARRYARSKSFDCSCCPTNICRFIPSVPGYAYAVGDDGPYVNLFVEGGAELEIDGKKLKLEQKTRYPWDGEVEITVAPETAGDEFALHVRVPGWSRGEAWPSDLYAFLDKSVERPTLSVNGQEMAIEPVKGYAVIERAWQPGDKEGVASNCRCQCGAWWRTKRWRRIAAAWRDCGGPPAPLVFCVEGADVEGGKVSDLVLPDAAELTAQLRSDLLGGVEVVTGEAQRREGGAVHGDSLLCLVASRPGRNGRVAAADGRRCEEAGGRKGRLTLFASEEQSETPLRLGRQSGVFCWLEVLVVFTHSPGRLWAAGGEQENTRRFNHETDAAPQRSSSGRGSPLPLRSARVQRP